MSFDAPNIGALIEERVIRAISINLEDRHEDVVRFAEALGIEGQELLDCCADPDALERSLIRVYGTPFEDRRDAIATMIPRVADMRVHPVGAALLRAIGLEPADLAYVSAWSGESASVELPGGIGAGLYWVQGENRASISVGLGRHVQWEHDGMAPSVIEVDLPIPDTLKPSLIGRRLMDVVSHPLLDPLGLVIARCKDIPENESVVLTVVPEDAPKVGSHD